VFSFVALFFNVKCIGILAQFYVCCIGTLSRVLGQLSEVADSILVPSAMMLWSWEGNRWPCRKKTAVHCWIYD